MKAKNSFIKPRGLVDHFIARRPFIAPMAYLGEGSP